MEQYYNLSGDLYIHTYDDDVLADATSPPNVTITRLSDDVVIVTNAASTKISTGLYKYTLSSSNNSTLGTYKAAWSWNLNGSKSRTVHYSVIVPYSDPDTIRDEYPEIANNSNDELRRKERLARRIIDSYCNQTFDFELDVVKKVRGENENVLLLPRRIFRLDTVSISGEDDITLDVELKTEDYLQVLPTSNWYSIKHDVDHTLGYFKKKLIYYIGGDWGWETVPEDIVLASSLLIRDYFDDDMMLHQHGIVAARMGDAQFQFNWNNASSTGNYDVDKLLDNFRISNITLL